MRRRELRRIVRRADLPRHYGIVASNARKRMARVLSTLAVQS
jgi:hypothetical protein